jgi:hypothetical protein
MISALLAIVSSICFIIHPQYFGTTKLKGGKLVIPSQIENLTMFFESYNKSQFHGYPVKKERGIF